MRGTIFTVVEQLMRLEDEQAWRQQHAVKSLSGNGKGLDELKFSCEGNQYRIIGFFDKETEEFIALYAFQKKSTKDYNHAIKEAKNRKQRIENEQATREEYDFS